ncbi:MAG: 5-oxoprolinase subunit PxpB [Limisphaerales bacterium]
MVDAAAIRFLRYGPHAWLLRLPDGVDESTLRWRLALERALARRPPAGLLEVTPGFTSLLLEFADEPPAAAALTDLLAGLQEFGETAADDSRAVAVPVVYDGPDLAGVATHAGLAREEVIRRHAAGRYIVALLGFAPGFPYLLGLDPALHTPRLDTPRPVVPAGSVAIGGAHTGIYPARLPGGWNLIGRTSLTLVRSAPANAPKDCFLFAPGDRVRFVPVDAFPADDA